MSEKRMEWAELWPDGEVRGVSRNHYPPVGWPMRPAPYAHRGTKWVRRFVEYSDWVVEDELWVPNEDGSPGEMPAHMVETRPWRGPVVD